MTTNCITAKRIRLARAIEREQFTVLTLSLGRRSTLRIERDSRYADMWRVRMPDGELSDMVNLARAKDAALDIAEGIEARKTPHKAPLKSLTNFAWAPAPAARKQKSDVWPSSTLANELATLAEGTP